MAYAYGWLDALLQLPADIKMQAYKYLIAAPLSIRVTIMAIIGTHMKKQLQSYIGSQLTLDAKRFCACDPDTSNESCWNVLKSAERKLPTAKTQLS